MVTNYEVFNVFFLGIVREFAHISSRGLSRYDDVQGLMLQ